MNWCSANIFSCAEWEHKNRAGVSNRGVAFDLRGDMLQTYVLMTSRFLKNDLPGPELSQICKSPLLFVCLFVCCCLCPFPPSRPSAAIEIWKIFLNKVRVCSKINCWSVQQRTGRSQQRRSYLGFGFIPGAGIKPKPYPQIEFPHDKNCCIIAAILATNHYSWSKKWYEIRET